MNFQTKISLSKQPHNLIDYKSKILLLGSCFTEHIGSKLEYFKFQSSVNPFGILFHPKAIESLVSNAVKGNVYSNNNIFFNNEQWHSFDAHSKLSNVSKDELLKCLNEQIKLTNQHIHESTHVVITLGTAWVYRHIKTKAVVANCHKVPQKEFKKELLLIDTISDSLQNIVDLIRSVNTNASIIFTVSPVRHLKDGFVENTLSKSLLISAIHQVIEARKNLHYFPSYEIMMDELRDYRFYNEDMIHPNPTAINYIWEKFKLVWFTEEVYKIMDEVDVIQKGLQHKPFNPNSEAHLQFLQKLEKKKAQLSLKVPHIVF
ncbi:GSCFA domain-containing protein [Seonamhaeicola sp. S2-3]|uniref:GSCFA domain-containing protein n=1 Tax=Seonamhaeicola sp. S2-3 TaxID=1936081 RepID=UPI0009728DB4|nr:GSCFA domain-containing protein [Seonamhaeicola sp. S2-3]APY10245.1 GSCFA domain-containing protein [Seonamhaeicola sp. S2-3]